MEKKYQGELITLPPVVVREKPIKYPSKTVGDRLELYRRSLGLKGFQFCKYIGVSQGSYSDIKNNKSLPSCNTLRNVALLKEVGLYWLLTGKKEK